jgi:hypothetical protein
VTVPGLDLAGGRQMDGLLYSIIGSTVGLKSQEFCVGELERIMGMHARDLNAQITERGVARKNMMMK